jgi:hypothetical protein
MILNNYIHEQLAAAYRRDALETAERSRLARQARAGARQPVRSVWRRRKVARPGTVEPCFNASSPRVACR